MRKPNRSSLFSCAGFTLLELVISMVATSLILGAAYTAFFSGLTSYSLNSYRSEIRSVLSRSLGRIVEDLRCAETGHEAFRFRVENDEIDLENLDNFPIPNDRLLFTAPTSQAQWANRPQSDLSEVEYYIDRDDESPARWLVRRSQSPPDNKPLEGGSVHLIGPRVIGMQIYCFDGSKWLEEWDSSTDLPLALRIILYVGPTRDALTPNRFESLSTTAWIARGIGKASSSDFAEEALP